MKAWASNCLEALHYLHSYGVIHVDVKLENLLISSPESDDEYPIAKLCDFGLCHLIDNNVGKAYMPVKCGTHGYIAPENDNVIIEI